MIVTDTKSNISDIEKKSAISICHGMSKKCEMSL